MTRAGILLPPRSYRDDFAVLVVFKSLSDNDTTLFKGLPERSRGLLQDFGMSIITLTVISQPNDQRRLSYTSRWDAVTYKEIVLKWL
jgi:hypothetical protein